MVSHVVRFEDPGPARQARIAGRVRLPGLRLAGLMLAIAAWLCAGPLAAPARAATAVSVLGVRSLDGEDALARKVSQALRNAVREHSEFQVSDRDVSLAQLALAQGCDESDPTCLSSIAETLAADRLIYGSMERAGAELRLALFSFDATYGRADGKLERRIHSSELGDGRLSATLSELVKQLLTARSAGTVVVVGDQPGAVVRLDGTSAGVLDARGELSLEAVPAGEHTLLVTGSDGTQRELPVQVRAGVRITVRVVLAQAAPMDEPPALDPEYAPQSERSETSELPPGRSHHIAAWGSAGLAAAMLGGAVYSWVAIGNINDDPAMRKYRAEFDSGVDNVCDEADSWTLTLTKGSAFGQLEAKARSNCRRAGRLEVAQWVLLGGAVVSAGVSTYLFLTLPKKSALRDQVRIQPAFGRGLGYVSASVRF
jgi:hypothetical protein